MPQAITQTDLAIFVATSGHSGVDRIVNNLLPEFSSAGLRVDLLKVRNHGPSVDATLPGVRVVDLGQRHVKPCRAALVRYLRRTTPRVLLSDKDRANRTALRAIKSARVSTRCFLRLGTTVSVNLAHKGVVERWAERRSMQRYSRADGVIVPSVGAADDLARTANLDRSTIYVLPNPIVTREMTDHGSDTADPPHQWLVDNARTPVVLGCGNLTGRKDYASLLRAFAALLQYRHARLIVLGRGPDRAALVDLARDLNIERYVDFPGFVANPIPWMKKASVFAHTARWEGLGIVLVEALACGMPIVAMDCPSGPSEILKGGQFGRLITPGDVASFSRALDAALAGSVDVPVAESVQQFRTDIAARRYIETLGL